MSGWLFLLQQTAAAGSLLMCLGLWHGLRKANLWRLTVTALICGAVTLTATLTRRMPVRMLALVLIAFLSPRAAWPGMPASRQLSMGSCCLLLTLLMSGCGRLLHTLGLSHTPLVLLQAALLPLLLRLFPRNAHASWLLLEITCGGHRLEMTALVDSGNLLRDPLTGLPVIVISQPAAGRLAPVEHGFPPGMRLLRVRTAAGAFLMPVFRPESIRGLLPGGWHTLHALIGLGADACGGFQALVPSSILSPS